MCTYIHIWYLDSFVPWIYFSDDHRYFLSSALVLILLPLCNCTFNHFITVILPSITLSLLVPSCIFFYVSVLMYLMIYFLQDFLLKNKYMSKPLKQNLVKIDIQLFTAWILYVTTNSPHPLWLLIYRLTIRYKRALVSHYECYPF